MSDYTIEGFWKRRLTVDRLSSRTLVQGWSLEDKGLATFKEAPLTRSAEFGEADPNNQPDLARLSSWSGGKVDSGAADCLCHWSSHWWART
jgi:hypothetical protein